MEWPTIHQILSYIQTTVSFLGVVLILIGVLIAAIKYFLHFITHTYDTSSKPHSHTHSQTSQNYLNKIRLDLSRTLILGLEFIVAADIIGTTTTPDYYSLGIVVVIVLIRTLLSFSLNKEIKDLSKENA